MQITVISDTHNEHDQLGRLRGEVLVHCGDMFNLFDQREDDLQRLDDWFGQQDFEQILCTGGNHDLALEQRVKSVRQPFRNAVYLQDKAYVFKGFKFYGAPWTPELKSHAFYRDDASLFEAWSNIPQDTDVLITHTPPAGILDASSSGLELGCKYLLDAVMGISPKLHCFGHVHASAGDAHVAGTRFVNACSVNSEYQFAHRPRLIEL